MGFAVFLRQGVVSLVTILTAINFYFPIFRIEMDIFGHRLVVGCGVV